MCWNLLVFGLREYRSFSRKFFYTYNIVIFGRSLINCVLFFVGIRCGINSIRLNLYSPLSSKAPLPSFFLRSISSEIAQLVPL